MTLEFIRNYKKQWSNKYFSLIIEMQLIFLFQDIRLQLRDILILTSKFATLTYFYLFTLHLTYIILNLYLDVQNVIKIAKIAHLKKNSLCNI